MSPCGVPTLCCLAEVLHTQFRFCFGESFGLGGFTFAGHEARIVVSPRSPAHLPRTTGGYQIGIATNTFIPHTGDKLGAQRCSQQRRTGTAVWKETRSVDDNARSRRADHEGRRLDREQRTSPTRPPVSGQRSRAGAAAPQQPQRRWLRTVRISGKTLCALASAIVLALAGYAWNFVGDLSNVSTVNVLGDDAGGPEPLDGSRDILLVGMDSRTDAQGNPLPEHIMNDVLHVGGDGDTENTDTIILLHIPQDTEETVAMSIPRDAYVNIP